MLQKKAIHVSRLDPFQTHLWRCSNPRNILQMHHPTRNNSYLIFFIFNLLCRRTIRQYVEQVLRLCTVLVFPPFEFSFVHIYTQALEFRTPLFPHLVPPAIMVWIFVWKYIFEPFIHILQHFVLQLSRSTNFCF